MENRRRYIKTALIVCAVLSHFSCPGGKSYQAGRAGDSIFLHLINYNYSRGSGFAPQEGINISPRLPAGFVTTGKKLEWREPGSPGSKLNFSLEGGRLKFALPIIREYCLVVFAPQ